MSGKSQKVIDYDINGDPIYATQMTKERFNDHTNTHYINKSTEMNPRRANYLNINLTYEEVLERHR